ncbi:MAG: effector binding domain-containing protein [Alphaproteobacteria bacterium]|nr:effector binding domain-containing protein [Alphaproteobacteria bacterium]
MTSQTEKYGIKAGLAEVKTFDIVGISVVTNNKKATEDINNLWERFFKESIGQSVVNKTDDVIYAVYSNYEGDHTKPYRLTIGYRVNTPQTAEQMHRICVEEQDYAIMSASGEQPSALIEAWTAIWSSDLDRSYKTDFEVYGPRFFEDGVNEVLIHIGVKKEEERI